MAEKQTGRFHTRRALEDRVVYLHSSGLSGRRIAEHCGLGRNMVTAILQAHAAGETITAQLEAGAREWDMERERRPRWDRFDPCAPLSLGVHR